MLDLLPDLHGQLGQGLVGALHLAVSVEIFLGVLLGGERGIQGDGHRLVGIVVQGLEGLGPGLCAVAVGVQQLSVDPVGVALFRILHLAELQVVLLHVPLQGGLHDPAQVGGFLADVGEDILLRVVMLQQGGHGAVGDGIVPGRLFTRIDRIGRWSVLSAVAVHGQGQGAEFHGTAIRVGDVGGEAFLPYGLRHPGKCPVQPFIVRIAQSRGGQVCVDPGLIAQLLGQDRGDARKAAVERLKDRLGPGGKGVPESLPVGGQGVQLVLGGGYEVGFARQHLPQGADGGGDVLDAVDDSPLRITEDDVAVLPHDLHHQSLPAQVAHLVQVLHVDVDDALQPRLGDARDAPVLEMLAQEHAEARGRHGAGLGFAGEIEQGQGSLGGNQQLRAVRLLDGEQQLVRLGLGDFIEPPAGELSFQFRYHICYGHAVKGHLCILRP